MKLPKVILKPNREKSVLNRHPWIFSGALSQSPDCEDGSLVEVRAHDGRLLGSGYFNSQSSIVVRLLAFDSEPPLEALERHLAAALAQRSQLRLPHTTAYRLINSEGDFLPGLIVDRYADVLVLQIGTRGMHALRDRIVKWLADRIKPQTIFEKSAGASRSEEGLDNFEGPILGPEPEPLEVQEYGHRFRINFRESQKTGFFLDQREMRAFIGAHARGKSVLNCFSYTGGFSVYAAKAGASTVESVDISAPAVEHCKHNFLLNDIDPSGHRFLAADVFDHLRSGRDQYDVVVLDPPAFAKKKNHVVQACRGYSDINREGIRRTAPGGLLVTSSCSHYIDEKLFQQVVFQASRDAGREVQVLGLHRHAFDHPVSIFHPEGAYLKSLILQVR